MWTGVWPGTLLVRLGITSSTCVAKGRRVLHRAPRDAHLTTWAPCQSPDSVACPPNFWGEGRMFTTLVDDSPPKAAMHLPLGSSVRCYCGTVSCSRVPGSLDNIPCIDRLDMDWTSSTNPSPPGADTQN